MKVREAEVADAPRIAELSEVLGYPVTSDVMAGRLRRLLQRGGDRVLVAEGAAGEIIGWIHGSEQELLEAERRCEILGLVVAPEQQGRGVGRRLVLAMEGWARERGLTQVAVRSSVLRAGSHPFYQRLGYERTKTQHAYRKQLSQSVLPEELPVP